PIPTRRSSDLAIRAHAKIHACITAQVERAIDALRKLGEIALHALRQILRRPGHDPMLFLVASIPFDLARGDAGHDLRKRTKVDLPHRKGLQAFVAEDAYIQLATLYVFLDERIRLRLLVNELNAFLQPRHIRDD